MRATVSLAKLAPKKLAQKISGLVDRFMKECGRGQASAAYARESVAQLGALLEASPEYDGFNKVSGMLQEFIGMSAITAAGMASAAAAAAASTSSTSSPADQGDQEKSKAGAGSSKEKTDAAMRSRAIECLGSAWPVGALDTQRQTIDRLVALFSDSITASVWRVRVAITAAAGKILSKLSPSVGSLNKSSAVTELIKVLRVGADDIKFHQVRNSSVAGVLVLCKRAAEDEDVARMCRPAVAPLRALLRLLRDDTDPGTAQKAALAQLELEKWKSI